MAALRRRTLVLRIVIALAAVVTVFFALHSAYGRQAGRRLNAATLRAEQTWLARPPALPRRVAPADNRAKVIAAAAAVLALDAKDILLLRRVTRFSEPESLADDVDALAAVLDRNRRVFEFLDGAGERADSAPQDLNVTVLLRLGRLVAVKASLAVHRGDVDQAVGALEQGYLISGSLAQETDVLLQLVRVAIDRLNHGALRALLTLGEPDEESLMRLERRVAASANRDDIARSVVADLVRLEQLIVELENGIVPDPPGPRCPSGFFAWLWRPLLLDDHRSSLSAMEGIAQSIRRPPYQRAADELRGRLAVHVECLAPLELAYDTVASRADAAEARRLLAGIALALRRHRLDHGAYPPSLAALSPVYLAASPIDPYTGRPPGFRRQGAGFVLRSAGEAVPDADEASPRPADKILHWEMRH